MNGCRSLTDPEIQLILTKLETKRDKALFVLGLKTGFRISELLSLTWEQVYSGQVLDRVKVRKCNTKGRKASRDVVLHPLAKEAILAYASHAKEFRSELTGPLFKSRTGCQSITRYQAHKILKKAYHLAGLTGHVATHSMRKSFAKKVYQNLKYDLLATRDALGHSSITNTIKYLEVNQDAVDAAILAA